MTTTRMTKRIQLSIGQTVDTEPRSRRMKVYQLHNPGMVHRLQRLARQDDIDKILFYVKREQIPRLIGTGCVFEGYIHGFFRGETAYIFSLFLNPDRNHPVSHDQQRRVMNLVKNDHKKIDGLSLPEGYVMSKAVKADTPEMARLYDTIFETYPTPMNDPQYISDMMDRQVFFSIIRYRGRIVSACSADLLPTFNSAEITDCATLPQHRNQLLLSHQFSHQVQQMRQKKVQTLFCYARAVSAGMNLITARHGFTYGGRMVQNSQIAGRLECMNIWFKQLL